MQYILTEEEYRNFVPMDWYKEEKAKVELLNNKVVELSGYLCGSSNGRFYCDGCPIGAFGTKTCTKNQQYSK